MIFDDMRQFIDKADELGEYVKIDGADWDLEIGLISEWQASLGKSPLLLFDKIKGYPPGYRVAANLFATPRRTALALGLHREVTGMELVKTLRDKMSEGFKMIPPVEVKTAPVKENVILGDDIDVFKFPTPKWHELDGGRYSTGHAVITKDPDEGWVNLGMYRVQLQNKRAATLYTLPGRHGAQMMRKWWAKGQNCPAAIATGLEPALSGTAHFDVPWGTSEYDYTGGWRGKPIEVTPGVTVDLPIPATAEIVLEGELVRDETMPEGPFGEYNGYYASGVKPMPVFRVNAVLHRTDPIIHGAPPLMWPSSYSLAHNFRRAANAWSQLDKLVPGVKGVWMMDYAAYAPVVVSIEQKYAGHAKQAAMAVLSAYPTAFLNRFVIVVDDDIDPSDMSQVFWAMATRCDPETSIDIAREIWGSDIDPRIHPDKKARGEVTLSTAIILACKPFEWKDRFPPTIMSSPDKIRKVEEKWGRLFSQ